LRTATIIREIDRDRLAAVVIGHELASDREVVRAVRARFPVSIRRSGVRLPGERPTTVELYLPKVPKAPAPSKPT
jgi:hypothetical protein